VGKVLTSHLTRFGRCVNILYTENTHTKTTMTIAQHLFQQVMTRFPQEMASLTALEGLNIINQVADGASPDDTVEVLYHKVVTMALRQGGAA